VCVRYISPPPMDRGLPPPPFYRPRRKQFTGVPHCSSYVQWHGEQYDGVDDRPGESGFWRSVMACPVGTTRPGKYRTIA
jgi:hypothetical protein